jgi:hypothetical protein
MRLQFGFVLSGVAATPKHEDCRIPITSLIPLGCEGLRGSGGQESAAIRASTYECSASESLRNIFARKDLAEGVAAFAWRSAEIALATV